MGIVSQGAGVSNGWHGRCDRRGGAPMLFACRSGFCGPEPLDSNCAQAAAAALPRPNPSLGAQAATPA
jgi:hypothetical protein